MIISFIISFRSGFPTYSVSSQQHLLHVALLASAQPRAALTAPDMEPPVAQGLTQPHGEPICTSATMRSWMQQSQKEHR